MELPEFLRGPRASSADGSRDVVCLPGIPVATEYTSQLQARFNKSSRCRVTTSGASSEQRWPTPGISRKGQRSPTEWSTVGNMPTTKRTVHGRLATTEFARTPRMPSYLVEFTAGDLHEVAADHGGVHFGVWAVRGHESEGTEGARFKVTEKHPGGHVVFRGIRAANLNNLSRRAGVPLRYCNCRVPLITAGIRGPGTCLWSAPLWSGLILNSPISRKRRNNMKIHWLAATSLVVAIVQTQARAQTQTQSQGQSQGQSQNQNQTPKTPPLVPGYWNVIVSSGKHSKRMTLCADQTTPGILFQLEQILGSSKCTTSSGKRCRRTWRGDVHGCEPRTPGSAATQHNSKVDDRAEESWTGQFGSRFIPGPAKHRDERVDPAGSGPETYR